MFYLSLCSGIEAASVAWLPLGWQAVAYSEIEPFACAVLAHHYPDVPNIGDMTKIKGEEYHGAVGLIVGGTPCQDFSVAGKRVGMAGERGRLAIYYLRLVDYVSPRWIVWENVPGVLSSNGGRDFGTFLRALDDIGYSCAWRVLDAQYFGVPQRRRRVFLVGHFGDWRPAAAVLFESHCLRRDTPPRREARKDAAGILEASFGRSGEQSGYYIPEIGGQAISCKWSKGTSGPAGDEHHNLVVTPPRIMAFHGSQDPSVSGDVTHPCGRNGGQETCIMDVTKRVRRLTPRECERLQGFPDDYTAIVYRGKPVADAPRYRALGNSMAVPVMRWIGERINYVEEKICAKI